MSNILFILFCFCFLNFCIFFFISFFDKKLFERLEKRTNSFKPFISSLKEQELNPDINTDNWHLHKLRLEKFKRSQYKGLTFFVCSEDRIYYLSEKGIKIYC